jgi:PAS domain S-box-containing protein
MGARHRRNADEDAAPPGAPESPGRTRGFISRAAALAALTGVYVGAAKGGIGLSVAHGVITPVWAPTGISIAALFLFGPRRLWPAVAAGAFVANTTSGAGALLACGIAVGNTFEAVVAAHLLRRLGIRSSLDRVRDVLALVVLGALASTTIAATTGVAVLAAGGKTEWNRYGAEWVLWWFGDAVGALLVTPLLLVAWAHRHRRPTRRAAVEAAVLLAVLGGAGAGVFLAGGSRYPYLLFPLLIAATLRFHQIGAAASSFVVGALATAGTVAGTVPISKVDPTERVQILQALTGVVAVSLLTLAATLAERAAATDALAQAQALTHIGSWEWGIRTDAVTWSDELYRIYGLEPQSVAIDYRTFLDRVHPGDRKLVEHAVGRAYAEGGAFSFVHRIVLDDGRERIIHGRGSVVRDESGAPTRMVGTAQDVTEQHQVERLRDSILAAVSHELRTPLTAVLGFAKTLKYRRDDLPEPVVDDIVAELTTQAERLDDLLVGLLDLDRLRRGLLDPAPRQVDLTALAERVAATYEERGRQVEMDVAGEAVEAKVDPRMVERIVDNLLANAVRHASDGSLVSLAVKRNGDGVLITVDDDGPGVPDELKERIFEIFDRGGADGSSVPGTGIGLSLVAQFAALHGGRAWVEDRPGGGASFRVALP